MGLSLVFYDAKLFFLWFNKRQSSKQQNFVPIPLDLNQNILAIDDLRYLNLNIETFFKINL